MTTRAGNDADAAFVNDALHHLQAPAAELARLCGVGPSAVSQWRNKWAPLPDYARARIVRLIARKNAHALLERARREGRSVLSTCDLPVPSGRFDHLETCPQCLAVAYAEVYGLAR